MNMIIVKRKLSSRCNRNCIWSMIHPYI